MFKLTTVTVLSLLALVHAQTSIDWKGCSPNPLIECGSFQVPLDYTNSGLGNVTLAVARYKAHQEPRLGSIFTNPGGPGGSGAGFIHSEDGELISNATNGHYDIVGWDPRGVNLTTPGMSCGFKTQDELDTFWNGTILGVGVEARGNFTDQKDIDAFYAQMNKTQAKAEEFGQACVDHDGDFLKYMGTTSVVRDMVALSDALEGRGKQINYWGFSYGTVLGNFFINMFPDRVGRVILDGVVDPITWTTLPPYKEWAHFLTSSEATLSGFTDACAQAGPQRCALAHEGSTGASIKQDLRDLIDTAYDAHRPDIATSVNVRNDLFNGLFTPKTWTSFAEQIAAIKKNFTDIGANVTQSSTNATNPVDKRAADKFPPVLTNGTNLVPNAIAVDVIHCLDALSGDNETIKDGFDELLRITHEISPTFGENVAEGPSFICHSFPVRSVEPFNGPFNHTLSNPILVIGNEADPVTPFPNAKAVADRLGNSAILVKQVGFGHASLAERSNCTTGVINDYFLQGKLPQNGKVCETDEVLFPASPAAKRDVSARAWRYPA